MVVYQVKPDRSGQLALMDLEHPAAAPKPLTPPHNSHEYYSLFAVTADGKGVYYTRWRFVTQRDTWDLLRVDLMTDKPEAEVVCENPHQGEAGQLLPDGRMLLWDGRPFSRNTDKWMIDLRTGTATQWRPPTPWLPGQENLTRAHPRDVCFAPDGKRLAFAAGIADPMRKNGSATLIWTCNLDGSELKQVTPWRNDVVPMAQ